MKARRTHLANFVYRLEGGTEDNDLWVHRGIDAGGSPVIRSCWVPTDEERAAIAAGREHRAGRLGDRASAGRHAAQRHATGTASVMSLPNSRLLWVARRASFASRRARIRAVWHIVIRRHRYEICMACGRPVGPHTGSWWSAPDALWARVIGDPHSVVCPPCFTRKADEQGIAVCWEAVEDRSS